MGFSRKIKDDVFHIMRLSNNTSLTREKVDDILDENAEFCELGEEEVYPTAMALQAILNVHVTDPNELLLTCISNDVNNCMGTVDQNIRTREITVGLGIRRRPMSVSEFKTDLVVLSGITNDLDRVLAVFSYVVINMPFRDGNVLTSLVWLTVALAEAANGSIIDLGQKYKEFHKKLEECYRSNDTVPMFLFLKSVYAHLSVK